MPGSFFRISSIAFIAAVRALQGGRLGKLNVHDEVALILIGQEGTRHDFAEASRQRDKADQQQYRDASLRISSEQMLV